MAWSRKDWLILVLLTGVAAFFRFFQLRTLPPGFQFDEAFNAIDAQSILEGSRPLFLPANAGREVLYSYWQALLIHLFGLNAYSLRLASAIIGVLTIAVTYLLVRALLRRQSRATATATALVLAISLWHIHFSRYGIRVITMPLIFSGAFGLAWLGAFASSRRTRILSYLGCGLLTGISVWTHPTGRLAPFVLIGFTLWLLWQYPTRRRWGWDTPLGGLLITGITAFIVFLPLGLEFYHHPEFFFGHASEVSVFAERVSGDAPTVTLLDNFLHVLGMFSFAGDLGWTHGLAGRPVFDWPLALLFYLGIILGALLIFSRHSPPGMEDKEVESDKAALVLFAIWSAVMLFPSILSEAAPNFSRTLPALPALFVPAGLGIAWLINLQRPLRWLGPALASIILLYSTGQMSYDYFVRFAQSPDVYYMYDGDKLDALNYLSQFTGSNEVYLSQLWGDMHSTVYLLRQGLGIKSVDTADTIVLPPPGKGALYAFPSEQLERAQQVAALWPGLNVESIHDPYGKVLLYTVLMDAKTAQSWPPSQQPTMEHPAAFKAAPALVGMLAASPDKQITLFWKADQPIYGNLTTFVQFIDRDGEPVAQADKLPGNGSYPTPVWTTGERVIDRAYPVLTDLCAGGEPVRVQVGWYELRDDNPQRPRADNSGTTALAGEMSLAYFTYPLAKFQPEVTTGASLSPTLTLEGYTLDDQELQAGSPFTLDLLWSSHNQNDKSASGMTPVRLSLSGKDGMHPLWQGPIAPGSRWDNGLALCRRVHANLPADLPIGNYSIVLDQPSVTATLPVTLGTVPISPSTRLYTVPPLARTIGITLTDSQNGQIALLGLGSEPAPDLATNQLTIDIVWQAASHIDGNYKVFIHLLDNAGSIVAQSDAIPGGGKGTSRWLPGEVIVDHTMLALPPDLATSKDLPQYQLVAGLYDPISMQRLIPRRADGSEMADGRVPLGSPVLPAR